MKRLLNVSEQLGNLGEQLEVLSALVVSQPGVALKRLSAFAEPLLPVYKRRFRDGLLDEEERALLQGESVEEHEFVEDLEDHVRLILEDIDAEFNNNRVLMKTVLMLYNREQKYNFGNRVLQLCDLIAGSFQSGLAREHVRTVLEFIGFELRKMSRIIGNDY